MMAKALEENGAKVYIIGRRQESLEKASKQAVCPTPILLNPGTRLSFVLQKFGKIIPMQGDVTNKADLERIVTSITLSEGYINVLIANSGISGPRVPEMPPNPSLSQYRDFLWKTDIDEFTNTFNVNISAVFFCAIAFLDLLDEGNKKGNVQQKSQVITTSSIGGYNRLPFPGFAYAASKAGVTFMMKQLATAFVPYGIRSNVIAPGRMSLCVSAWV